VPTPAARLGDAHLRSSLQPPRHRSERVGQRGGLGQMRGIQHRARWPSEAAPGRTQWPLAAVTKPAASKSAHTAAAGATGTPSQPAMSSTSALAKCAIAPRTTMCRSLDCAARSTFAMRACGRSVTSVNWSGRWNSRSEYVETIRDRAAVALSVRATCTVRCDAALCTRR
jgi:hypothetical protein